MLHTFLGAAAIREEVSDSPDSGWMEELQGSCYTWGKLTWSEAETSTTPTLPPKQPPTWWIHPADPDDWKILPSLKYSTHLYHVQEFVVSNPRNVHYLCAQDRLTDSQSPSQLCHMNVKRGGPSPSLSFVSTFTAAGSLTKEKGICKYQGRVQDICTCTCSSS